MSNDKNKSNKPNTPNTVAAPNAATTPPVEAAPTPPPAVEAPVVAEATGEVVSGEAATGIVVAPAHEGVVEEQALRGTVVAVIPDGDEPIPDVLNREKPFNIFAPGAFRDLAKLFPNDAMYLRRTQPVDDEKLEDLIAKLPDQLQSNFRDAMEKLTPMKVGDHRARRSAIQTYDVRVYHGTGDDPMRPMLVTEGGLYGSDGTYLAAANPELAEMHKAPASFDAYVLGGYDVNTLWPPREKEKEAALVFGIGGPDDDTKANAPICRSLDREWGDTYGSCASCTLRPFRGQGKGKEEAAVDEEVTYGCRSEVQLWVAPRDLSGIYRFVFAGTNAKIGRAILKKTQPWKHLHSYFFRMTTEKEVSKTDKKQRWFLVKAEERKGKDDLPQVEVTNVLAAIARKIDTEYYWPERRRIHLSVPKVIGGGTGTGSDGSDMLALSGADDAPKGLPAGTQVSASDGASRPRNI